jgi:hypothetical protein
MLDPGIVSTVAAWFSRAEWVISTEVSVPSMISPVWCPDCRGGLHHQDEPIRVQQRPVE